MRTSTGCAVLLLVLASLLPGPGCRANDGEPEAAPRRGIVAHLSLHGAGGEALDAFGRGEAITLRLTLENPGPGEQRLPLASAQTHDLRVTDASGQELWRWSQGRFFAQVLGELTLAPGASQVFTATWNPGGADGREVGPGRYVALGWIPCRAPQVRADPVEFTIR